MYQLQVLHQLPRFEGNTAIQNLKQSSYLVAYLIGYLVALAAIKQSLLQRLQHELDKKCGLGLLIRSIQGSVISVLLLANHRLHRQPGQNGTPPAKYQRLPQAPHPPVAIGERMDEFEFVVKYTAGKQRVQIRAGQPVEQVVHQRGHTARRRCPIGQHRANATSQSPSYLGADLKTKLTRNVGQILLGELARWRIHPGNMTIRPGRGATDFMISLPSP
ncbi:putative membrane protein [Pseudomonas chlororaphis subsp. piscium]|nr:putative membrane protein [Pseudomonas chlororaphis subsp. piscium]